MELTRISHDEYVKMSIDSGVSPLELGFIPVKDSASGDVLGFRTHTTIHSIMLGTLAEETYTPVIDGREINLNLLVHNIQHAITALGKFKKAGKSLSFLNVRCPAELCENDGLYDVLCTVVSKNPSVDFSKIVLEFPATLLERSPEKAKRILLDLKLLKMRTAINSCGTVDFPVNKLIGVTPDYVFLVPEATSWANDRNKPKLFTAFVSYLRSMGIESFAEVPTEPEREDRRALRIADCSGYCPLDGKLLTEEEALAEEVVIE